jgi:hypothetical protein
MTRKILHLSEGTSSSDIIGGGTSGLAILYPGTRTVVKISHFFLSCVLHRLLAFSVGDGVFVVVTHFWAGNCRWKERERGGKCDAGVAYGFINSISDRRYLFLISKLRLLFKLCPVALDDSFENDSLACVLPLSQCIQLIRSLPSSSCSSICTLPNKGCPDDDSKCRDGWTQLLPVAAGVVGLVCTSMDWHPIFALGALPSDRG